MREGAPLAILSNALLCTWETEVPGGAEFRGSSILVAENVLNPIFRFPVQCWARLVGYCIFVEEAEWRSDGRNIQTIQFSENKCILISHSV